MIVLIRKRKFLTNGDLVKHIGPLPEEVDEIDMKVNLRGTKKPGIYFIYDSSTSLLKIQIRYTTLNIKVDPQDSQYSLENLFQNKDVKKNDKNEENNVPVPAPVVVNEDIEIIGKIFQDTDAKTMYKVKSVLNENEIEVVEFEFMSQYEFGEQITYNKSKAMLLISEQDNN